jgi:hypothetical protein
MVKKGPDKAFAKRLEKQKSKYESIKKNFWKKTKLVKSNKVACYFKSQGVDFSDIFGGAIGICIGNFTCDIPKDSTTHLYILPIFPLKKHILEGYITVVQAYNEKAKNRRNTRKIQKFT